jgi:hypothetical protein
LDFPLTGMPKSKSHFGVSKSSKVVQWSQLSRNESL